MVRKVKVPSSADIKRRAEQSYKKFTPSSARKDIHYYIYGITPSEGRTVYWGPRSLEEADMVASSLIDGEVFEFETIDLKKATAAIKAEMLDRQVKAGANLDEALKRGHHTGFNAFFAKIRGKRQEEHIIDSHQPLRR